MGTGAVGAYAGAEVMSGLLKIRVPLITRRAITVIPAVVILAFGVNPLWALIFSQVVLSFGIPFALIPLIAYTRKRSLMGDYANTRVTTALAVLASLVQVFFRSPCRFRVPPMSMIPRSLRSVVPPVPVMSSSLTLSVRVMVALRVWGLASVPISNVPCTMIQIGRAHV